MQAAEKKSAGRELRFTKNPLSFEPNVGQVDPAAQFVAHGAGYSVKLESSRAVLDFDSRRVTLELLNAAARPTIRGEAPLPGKANYFGSSDPKTWFTNIPTYSRVQYKNIYPGIGVAFYGKDDRLEYDFLLDAGASADRIRMSLAGAESARTDAAGDLVLDLGKGQIRFYKPVAWQPTANGQGRENVEAGYRLSAAGGRPAEVTFALGRYDSKRPLVIDPVVSLIYSAYTGASSSAVAVDASGNTYVTGVLSSYGYYVTKFSPTGAVVYSNSFGSGIYSTPYALAVDSTGRAYVAGQGGPGLPTTTNAYQTSDPSGSSNAFFSVLSASGSSLVYATYLGGTSGNSSAYGVAVDSSANAYLTGTASPTFPVTSGAYDTTFSGSSTGFVAKINPSLSGTASLIYSTYLGASGSAPNAIAVDSSGHAYVTGNMANGTPITPGAFTYTGAYSTSGGVYVTELNSAGSALVYSAYLGYGTGWGIAVDGAGNAYVTGSVGYADFPTTAGGYQTAYAGGFVAELPPGGATETYSTFVSGPSGYTGANVTPTSIAIPLGCASSCSAYVSGWTSTADFPLINAVQTFPSSSGSSGFVVELSANGSTAVLSTYLSGATADTLGPASSYYSNSVPALAVDSSGNISVIENVTGTDFPVTIPGALTVGVLAKIGTATAGFTWATPTSVNFPSQPVNVSTAITNGTAAITLRNLASTAVTLQPVLVSPPSIFSESDNCNGSIPGGGYCTLQVNFTPAAPGQRNGTLTVSSNASNSPATFALSGTGVDEPYAYTPTSSLTFADQAVGTLSTPQSITITNMGDETAALSLSTSIPDFTELNNCPSQVPPGFSCTVNVSFIPTQPGLRSGYLNISGYGTASVALSGTGTVNGNATGLALSATSLNFGVQPVGSTSPGQYVYITNTSAAPVTINSMTVSGNYTLSEYSCTVPGQIAPQSNCSVYIQFAPTATGTLTGTLTINDSTPASPHTVSLTGTGQTATKSLEFYPGTAIQFPNQPVGYASAYQLIYVYNAGTATVTVDRVETTGAFQIYSSNCEATTINGVTPGPKFSYCYVYVTFTPTATGAQTGTLTIVDNAPTSPQVLSLSGNGIAPTGTMSATPTELTYPSQPLGITSPTQVVYITNPGNTPVTVTGQTPTGNYAITSMGGYCGTVPYTLAPGQYCDVNVAFTPTSTTNPRTGTLTLTSSAGNQTVALSGTGETATQTIGLTPTALGFGSQIVGQSTGNYYVYARNTGTATVTFTANPAVTGTNAADFSVTANSCGSGYTVAANSSCSFYVSFTPGANGARSATLKLTDSAGTQTLALTGTGVTASPTYTVSNYELAFDLQVQGTISPLVTYVYFYNKGASSVTLGTDAVTGNFLIPTGYDSCSGQIIAASSSCYTYVEFAPTTAGYLTGTLAFKNGSGTTLVSVPLAGYAPAPVYSALVDPGGLNFGLDAIGLTTSAQYVYLYNTGNLSLTVGTATGTNTIIGSSASGEFSAASAGGGYDYCSGTTVAAASYCYVYLTFTPSAAGPQSGSITLPVTYSNNTTASFPVSLTGSGVAIVDAAVLSPTAATFLDQVVGTTSPSDSVTLTNSGDRTLTVGTLTGVNIAVGSSPTGEFSTTASGGGDYCSGVSVAPGSACTVYIVFTPSAIGLRSGSVTFPVTYADSTTASFTASLSGNGLASSNSVQVTPAGMQFGNQIVGTVSSANTVQLTNTGSTPVTVGTDTITGVFAINSDSCASSTIQPGGICYVYVTFNPTASGPASGTLTIADNATGGPQAVTLSGVGIPASQQIVLSQTTVAFGNQPAGSSSSQTAVYISNLGSTNVTVTSIALSGTNAADFQMINNCSSSYFYADASCYIYLTFAPAVTASGARTASVTLRYGAGGSPQTIALTGTAVAPGPAAALTPASLTFAKQTVGVVSAPQTFSVTNTGSANLTVTLVASTNSTEFPISADGCSGATLTPNQQCVVAVKFSPILGGTRSGTITVADNATGSPQTVTLTGTGYGTPLAVLTPGSLSFGNQNIGTTSAAMTVTLSNPGTDVLNISGIAVTGADASEFKIATNNCPASLAPNGSCTVLATFTPAAAGTRGASIAVTDNANNVPGSVQNVTLSGTGVALPLAGVSPGSLTFANQVINFASAPQNVTLTNAGTGALTISGIAFTGTDAVDFAQSNGCGISLPAGANCTIAVTFKPAVTGSLTATLTVTDNANNVAGSTQSVTLSGTGIPTPVVTSVSVTPSAGAGTTETFTFAYSDSDGSTDLNTVYGLFNTTTSLSSACYVYYARSANLLYLENNAGTAAQGSVTPGQSGTVTNSQCTINGTGSSVIASGNNLTVAVSITFKAAFAGTKNIYMNATSNEGQSSGGLKAEGTWNTTADQTPTAVSVTPASGSGTSQTFSFAFADANGYQDLNTVSAIFNTSTATANACYVYYVKAANALYLENNAGTGAQGSVTPGVAGTVSNSQCTISGTGASVTSSGNNLTVAVPITFQTAFTGIKNVYLSATDDENLTSGWQQLGTWTP